MKQFKDINPAELKDNPFSIINDEWMLVTAGNKDKFNTMTASWGGVGVLWFKNVTFVFVRPGRYTYEFMEKEDYYTLSFLGDEHRDILTYCGQNSGRNVDKVKETGLTPVFDKNSVYFEESRLVMVCKKLYFQDIDPKNFLAEFINDKYPLKDYHRMYVGEIVSLLQT